LPTQHQWYKSLADVFKTIGHQCYPCTLILIVMDDRNKFFGFLNQVFEPIDRKIGPDKLKYKPACDEDKEMFLECVLASDCYKNSEQFKYCAQEGADKECKALRYDYYLCKRAQVFWNKSFSQDDPRGA
jgi:cytochrome c oxidase assembly factor 5